MSSISKEIFKKYNSPINFINRELSWIEFNRRVMEEALNPNLPILEKIKFISIFFSNLDEFYMVRVSGLKDQISAGFTESTIDGLTPIQQIRKIEEALKPMLDRLMSLWQDELVPALRENNIHICEFSELDETAVEELNQYFKNVIYPVLTPLAFDPGRPFPYISNLSLSFAILVKNPKGEQLFARVKFPSSLPRLLQVDKVCKKSISTTEDGHPVVKFIWLGDLIKNNLTTLFPKMEVVEAYTFRITRDTDFEIQDDEADDLLKVIEENIIQRRFGTVVRLEVEKNMPAFLIDILIENLEIHRKDVSIVDGPLALSNLMELYSLPIPELKENPYVPIVPMAFESPESIFSLIKEKDILIHHPYESFAPVIDFIKQASADPDVLAIKQTLYRIGPKSPIVEYLIEAVERGKQVAVLVELKARFDEENNIFWARELEKVGAHVVYGLVGLKTHAKMTLVVRKEMQGLKRYVHLATGNYNASTAKLYTDLGLFTCNDKICSDVSDVFNYLTGYSKQDEFNHLTVAPINYRDNLFQLIYREIKIAGEGRPARIIMKANALVDPEIITALYEASNAGVVIELIIRGICCLIPGVAGLSENIRVTSIVGRFLEHSRIFYFLNDGEEEIYLSSADIMQRNLDRRIEVAFPILSTEIKKTIKEKILNMLLSDNSKARILRPDGVFERLSAEEGDKPVNAQEWFMKQSMKVLKKRKLKIKMK